MAAVQPANPQTFNLASVDFDKIYQPIERDRRIATWLDVAKVVAVLALFLLPHYVPFFSAGWGSAATFGLMAVTFSIFSISSSKLMERAAKREEEFLRQRHFYAMPAHSFSLPATVGDLAAVDRHVISEVRYEKERELAHDHHPGARELVSGVEALDLAMTPASTTALKSHMANHLVGREEPWDARMEAAREMRAALDRGDRKEYEAKRDMLWKEIYKASPCQKPAPKVEERMKRRNKQFEDGLCLLEKILRADPSFQIPDGLKTLREKFLMVKNDPLVKSYGELDAHLKSLEAEQMGYLNQNPELARRFFLTKCYPGLRVAFESMQFRIEHFIQSAALERHELQEVYGIKREWPEFVVLKWIGDRLEPQKYSALKLEELDSLMKTMEILAGRIDQLGEELREELEGHLPRQKEKMKKLFGQLQPIQEAYEACVEAQKSDQECHILFEGKSQRLKEKFQEFEEVHNHRVNTPKDPAEALEKAKAAEKELLDEIALIVQRDDFIVIWANIRALHDLFANPAKNLKDREVYDSTLAKVKELNQKMETLLSKCEEATSKETKKVWGKVLHVKEKEWYEYPYESRVKGATETISDRKVEPIQRNIRTKDNRFNLIDKIQMVFFSISFLALPVAVYCFAATNFWISYGIMGGSMAMNLLFNFLEKRKEKKHEEIVTLRLAENWKTEGSPFVGSRRHLPSLTPELSAFNQLARGPLNVEGVEYTAARLLTDERRVRGELNEFQEKREAALKKAADELIKAQLAQIQEVPA